jgi:hypothetical protein
MGSLFSLLYPQPNHFYRPDEDHLIGAGVSSTAPTRRTALPTTPRVYCQVLVKDGATQQDTPSGNLLRRVRLSLFKPPGDGFDKQGGDEIRDEVIS